MTKWQAGISVIAAIEIFTGGITLIAVAISLISGGSTKPFEVLIFVLATSGISCGLGVGLLKRNLTSYHLLLFFSTVIILSKVLIFAKIITLSGALETAIPASIKNTISAVYHAIIILYFTREPVRKEFGEKRNTLFL